MNLHLRQVVVKHLSEQIDERFDVVHGQIAKLSQKLDAALADPADPDWDDEWATVGQVTERARACSYYEDLFSRYGNQVNFGCSCVGC